LEARIDDLISQDPHCQAFLQVLHALNYKAKIAPRKAEAKIRSILGDELFEAEEQAARKDSGLE